MKPNRKLLIPLAGLCLLAWACLVPFLFVNGQQYPDPTKNYFLLESARETNLQSQSKGATPDEHDIKAEQLALTQWQNGNFVQAEKYFCEQWQARRKVATTGYDQRFAQNALNLAGCYMDRGAFAATLDAYQSLLNYDRARLPKDDARVGRDLNNLGLCMVMIGETKSDLDSRKQWLQNALDNFERAEIVFRSSPKLESQLAYCLQNQAVAKSEMDQQSEAQALTEQVETYLKSWQKPPV